MSYSLNLVKKGYIGDHTGEDGRVIKGDTRSLDCSSNNPYIISSPMSLGIVSIPFPVLHSLLTANK